MSIHTTTALRLHAFGLTQLHDPNWTGIEMYDHLKDHMKQRVAPFDLLRKTLPNGLLYFLGEWLFEEFFFHDIHRTRLNGEYRLWYLDDLVRLLEFSSGRPDRWLLQEADEAKDLVEKVSSLYDEDEPAYWRTLTAYKESDVICRLTDHLINKNADLLKSVMPKYAMNYAQRVFHDRQLCEHICKTLIAIGFDGTSGDDEDPRQWVDRQSSWPVWALKAIAARDRGFCAECGVSIIAELNADGHIDHIIPLRRGGTNDLCNLQLLCEDCNLKKKATLVDALSSIPEYMKQKRRKKTSD